ncbi:sigma-70 family RNA polymerase sigma factor [Pseudenhygromyxa sp. WMMC2535]|uniref:RNA polymerase sigma factor RpoD/SigA n=1 Tax=Pseudenhygromyxa sp. WMMC2535 TaxID=2712867 RepID=UPI001554B9B7|nr:RNA polymerase sigma factor RpoD/SigA [Pseudenhygromyxa sp. WMMC2535]NVB42833.1 sigma-70 family RNA polymerase sigma factor [Pseudenhygromyxa sp. WMMC2535]
MATTQKITPPSSRSNRRRSETPLGSYLGEVSKVNMLTPDEEKSLAAQIADRRVALWRALLSYAPFASAITELIDEAMRADNCDTIPSEALEALALGSRAFRNRETKVNREAFQAAQQALAESMAAIDLDNKYADRIAADLEAIDANRREGVSLQVTYPPRGSRPFARYVQKVRAANQALRWSKNKFVKANLRLVVTIARRFDLGLMPLPDLVQEGNLGLMKAVDRFDGARGYRFSTYATWWIRHAINRALANKGRTVRLPAHVSADLQRLRRVSREFEAHNGRAATIEELAKDAGLSKARVRKLSKLSLDGAVSLDAPANDGEGRAMLDRLEDETPEMTQLLESRALADELYEALEELQPIEIDILRGRYGIGGGDQGTGDFRPMTLRELGEQHSLSRERIRQLQERALHKLRQEFTQRELGESF